MTLFRMKKRTKTHLIKRLLVLLFTVVIILLMAEIVWRLIGTWEGIDYGLYLKELKNPERLPAELFIHDNRSYWLRPNVQVLATTSDFSVIYKINSKGLRDKEYSYAKPHNKIRILAFGDSLTFGEGVKYGERFTDILENENDDLEIINFGVPGYGIDQELLLFMKEGVKYSSDYVILLLSFASIERYSTNLLEIGLDNIENVSYKNPKSAPTTLYLERDDPFFNKRDNYLLKNSYLLSYLNYHIQLLILKQRFEKHDEELWENIMSRYNYSSTKDASKTYMQNRGNTIINEFNEICRENNIKFILLNIDPYNSLDYLNDIDENITYYDLAPAIRNHSKKHDLSFKYDPHPNKRTHMFIANQLTRILFEITAWNSSN